VHCRATPTFVSSQIWNKGTTPVDSRLYVGRLPDCLGDEVFLTRWRRWKIRLHDVAWPICCSQEVQREIITTGPAVLSYIRNNDATQHWKVWLQRQTGMQVSTSHISCKRLATFRETLLYTCSGRYIRPAISIFRYLLTYSLTYLLTYFSVLFLSCKANPRVKLAKTGHGPHSSTLVVICVVLLLFVLFYVLFVYKCVLPPGDNPNAVNK
jgi:hypothetical protein